jgi:hypothetical protein
MSHIDSDNQFKLAYVKSVCREYIQAVRLAMANKGGVQAEAAEYVRQLHIFPLSLDLKKPPLFLSFSAYSPLPR